MKTPHDVFTPRSSEVNPEMYIPRRSLEDNLTQALPGQKHIVIHGESGSGKSWLYKHVLKDLGLPFYGANLSTASRFDSIARALLDLVDSSGKPTRVGYEETKEAEGNMLLLKAGTKRTDKYEDADQDPFEACLRWIRSKSGDNHAFLVLDNLETLFDSPKLLQELANLIILCDDPRYSRYDVKLIIVGVPKDLREYYYKTPNSASVGNRLTELPEVARLTNEQCADLCRRGFSDQLQFKLNDFDVIQEHIQWVTDRVPQQIHEYCLELATLATQNKGVLHAGLMDEADKLWIGKGYYASYAAIEYHMNEKETKAGRRNQALYTLGTSDAELFRSQEIEDLLRTLFTSTKAVGLNLSQILVQLASGDKPILHRSPKGDAFQFRDPRHRMVIRAVLRKTADDKVEKLPLTRK